MRRIVPLIAAAVAGIGLASQAHAGITATAVPVTPINAGLTSAGWSGYLIHLSADGVSQKITLVDFANNPLLLTGPIGIRGNLHQAGALDAINNDPANSLKAMHTKYGLPCDALLQEAPQRFIALLKQFEAD